MDNVERGRDFGVLDPKWDIFRVFSFKLRDLYRRGVERLSEPMVNDSKEPMFSTYNRTDNIYELIETMTVCTDLNMFKPYNSHRTKK